MLGLKLIHVSKKGPHVSFISADLECEAILSMRILSSAFIYVSHQPHKCLQFLFYPGKIKLHLGQVIKV